MKKTILITSILSILPLLAYGQNRDWGRVSASLESTHHVYVEDQANGFYPSNLMQLDEDGVYATNNYLKIDYYKGRLAAGTQFEGYFPTTVGYPFPVNKMSISNLYVSWRDNSYSVTAGSFYEQLGSGLLFRSWEDRALGMNNAMFGARATYNWEDKVTAKAFWGTPRLGKLSEMGLMMSMGKDESFFGFGLASEVNIAGADVSVSLSDFLDWNELSLSLEGSVINKHEDLSDALLAKGCLTNNVGWSARANLETSGFYAKLEYVDAGKQLVNQFFDAENGNAQLIELGYNSRGLGLSFTGRRLHRMTQQICTSNLMYASAANVMSYCPAMTTQYTYMLSALHPYNPEIGTNKLRAGEIGGQFDAFYNFRRGTKLGGKRGMKVHANFSTYFSLNENGGTEGSERLLTDFSFDVEKQWNKKFKTTVLYSFQDYNKHEKNYASEDVYIGKSHIVVADLLYKWNPKFSTRLELQYLASNDYQKDWMAALLEVSLAPHWSVFASDMYNHGDSKLHYYNAGLSYVYGKIRVAAGYGRYRAGFICSGGVCREIPAYTGANLTLTASF